MSVWRMSWLVAKKDLRDLLRRLLAFFAEPAEPAAP